MKASLPTPNPCSGCLAFDASYSGCTNLIHWRQGVPQSPPCYEPPERTAVVLPFKPKTPPTEAA